MPPVTQLVENVADKLFQCVLRNPEHTLYQLLPERRHDDMTLPILCDLGDMISR